MGSGAQQTASVGAQQAASAGAQHVGSLSQHELRLRLKSFGILIQLNSLCFFFGWKQPSSEHGAGTQQVGSEHGAGAQQVGSGAQQAASIGAQQVGSGAQPQLELLLLLKQSNRPASALLGMASTIIAAVRTIPLIVSLLLSN